MKKKILYLWIAFIAVGFCSESAAEFYNYRDKNGTMHFTDNLAEVPQNQLKKIKAFKSVKPASAVSKAVSKTADQYQKHSKNKIRPDLTTWDGKLRSAAQALEREQVDLDQKHGRLQLKRSKLLEIPLQALNPDEKKAHIAKAKKLTAKIKRYHKQCNVLKSKIAKFNKKF